MGNHRRWLDRSRGVAKILLGRTPWYCKALWIKAQLGALASRSKELLTSDPALRNRLAHRRLWFGGIYDEVTWWRGWLGSVEGQMWLSEVERVECPLQDATVARLLEELSQPSIRILDVGAGPVTHLGYTYPGKQLLICAIDPLAEEYARLLRELHVECPIPTIKGQGERLLDQFEPESFDLVYASNSLDHSYNPLAIVDNMLQVVTRGGFVMLRHYRNEGRTGNYHGLHQWNFDIRNGDLVIWNERQRHNLSHGFAEGARVRCHIEDPSSHGVFDYTEWVIGIFQKL